MEKLKIALLQEVHGNAYRHPYKYGMLVEEKIVPPFVRSDYRR